MHVYAPGRGDRKVFEAAGFPFIGDTLTHSRADRAGDTGGSRSFDFAWGVFRRLTALLRDMIRLQLRNLLLDYADPMMLFFIVGTRLEADLAYLIDSGCLWIPV